MYRMDDFMPTVHSELRKMSEDDEMICQLCNDVFKLEGPPVLLKCLHAVCQPCFEKHDLHEKLACLICHSDNVKENYVPYDNSRYNELVSYSLKHKSDKVVCTYRRHGAKGHTYCFQCGHFLCEECHGYHLDVEVTKSHKTVISEDLICYPVDDWKPVKKCSSHTDYPVELYCREESCRKFICLSCVTNHHSGHVTLTVKEAYNNEKGNLANAVTKLSNMAARIRGQAPLRHKASRQREQIRMAFEYLRDTIASRHEYLLEILDQHYGELHEHSEETQKELKENIQYAKTFYERAAMAIRSDSGYNLLQAFLPVEADLASPRNPDSHLVFVQLGLANLLQEIQTLGQFGEKQKNEEIIPEL